MIKSLYLVKDDLAGFIYFGDYVNDEVASRSFKISCNDKNMPVRDLSLYRMGKYDTETGTICESNLEFICRGERYGEE